MNDYFAKIVAALEHMNNAFRTGAVSPMAQSHAEQFGRAVAELRAAVPPLSEVDTRVTALETAVADLHAALSDKPSPASVQKAVADVEVPQP